MPSFLFFFYYVCVFYNLCEEKNPVLSLVGVFFWITADTSKSESKVLAPSETKLQKGKI